ncbi:MAG: glycolate oxidase subunit GlcF [Hyphomicrobiales bacterium]|nr:glycolate oxidase subunit GlcF [Hyphomicrobiales bacterium]MDE2116119.1 glycolate oxidase subunit GlcF [Hyphomicrobiales bacterium]
METHFSLAALSDSDMRESEKILRSCVHCGFCTATCPTYLLLGDELDSPRGRIYLIKDMLENEKPATAEVVKHVDRCLSCLACMTTCPSGVHYMHLVDHARAHIETTYKRDLPDRAMRLILATVLPYPRRFAFALRAARLARPLAPMIAKLPKIGARMAAMLALAPRHPQVAASAPALPVTAPKARVILLEGCAQPVLQPSINTATRRLLARLDVEVLASPDAGCCGALTHHLGKEASALAFVRANVRAWTSMMEQGPIDAIVITASGCGTTVKDYGFMLRNDPEYAAKAAKISSLAKDITEFLTQLRPAAPAARSGLVVAYHSACSMQHGQQIREEPKRLLKNAGYIVKDIPEGHICCGSAGTYNILQPELAQRLRNRKIDNVMKTQPQVVATGNIGCMTQLGLGLDIPIVHSVELLDWAYGGPIPEALDRTGNYAQIALPRA